MTEFETAAVAHYAVVESQGKTIIAILQADFQLGLVILAVVIVGFLVLATLNHKG